jgi:hypothetical protein
MFMRNTRILVETMDEIDQLVGRIGVKYRHGLLWERGDGDMYTGSDDVDVDRLDLGGFSGGGGELDYREEEVQQAAETVLSTVCLDALEEN